MKKHIFSLSAMRKFLIRSGAKSVSLNACRQMREILEEDADNFSKKAVKSALFNGRVVVKKEDFKLNN